MEVGWEREKEGSVEGRENRRERIREKEIGGGGRGK